MVQNVADLYHAVKDVFVSYEPFGISHNCITEPQIKSVVDSGVATFFGVRGM